MQIQKLKEELERRYQLVYKTPDIKINYDYFSLISEYVDWIENNKPLKETLYSTKSFEKYHPEALLIIKGWEIANAHKHYKNNKCDKVFISYLNLLAVCYGVHDLESGLKRKETDMKLFYREKVVEHLKRIKDGKKLIGYGYFWFHREKYRKWIKAVHQKLLSELAYLELEEEKEEKPKVTKPKKTNNNTISYEYDKTNGTGLFTIGENKITFEKDRALIIYYFYELKDIDTSYKTYRDFNEKMSKNVKSPFFRQSIERINLRINKENDFVKSIISQKTKNNPHKINRYKWKTTI